MSNLVRTHKRLIDIIEPTPQTVEALMKVGAAGVDIEIKYNYEYWINRDKLGMTREFIQSGQSVPVTVIKIETGRVIDIIKKTKGDTQQ